MSQQEQGEITGTRDRHYDLLWFTQACLDNVLRLQTYAQDAERDGDQELADFFRKAQADSQKGADQGKELLRSRLAK
jgi:predicted metal-dependent HD superfamily phosphohydrolase